MNKKDLGKLHDLAESLYAKELKVSGMLTIPYALSRRNLDGQVVIVAAFSRDANEIISILEERFK